MLIPEFLWGKYAVLKLTDHFAVNVVSQELYFPKYLVLFCPEVMVSLDP